jgi:two-component system sensor histidine kinase PilS (NtrC family)
MIHERIVAEVERRRFLLNLSLLKTYAYYRVFVGIALLGVFLQPFVPTRIGTLNATLFFWGVIAYSVINLVSAVTTNALPPRLFERQAITVVVVVVDVIALACLTYLSGGVSSGLGVVMLISVAAASIFLEGRASTFVAAIASIAMLYEEFYLALSTIYIEADYFQAGVLGITYFAAALSIRYLSNRLRRTEITSLSRAAEVADLERVNRSIVQRMRTGILVVDRNDHVRMANQSARSLLGLASRDEELATIPPTLATRLAEWRADTHTRGGPFQVTPTTPEIRANFSAVRSEDPSGDVIVFLEDTTEIAQQAQQLKLAALGRLSASIAHEIRNPLGAISHAAQLLSESQSLEKGDRRLTDIIHSHCKRLNGVIENVLEVSRRRPPSPIRLNLAAWLEQFVTEFKQAGMEDADIKLDVSPASTEIRIDPGQLGQAVTNLVQNGLRYSRAATGCAAVLLEGGIDPATERPYLNVIDRGPGVPEGKVKNLFEPFFTTERTGTGLGLYITRELCEANQARVTYSRHEGGGSNFRITFAHPDRISA